MSEAPVLGLLGRKVAVTQVFHPDGERVGVTVVEAGPCRVVGLRSVERDGFARAQIGFEEVPLERVVKPQRALFEARKVPGYRHLREVGLGGGAPVEVGQEMTVAMFAPGERVDIVGTSKGKGYQGPVKRHHFRGGPKSHGSMFNRAPGSIGSNTYPGRTLRGKRLGGHMGARRVTVKNVEIEQVDPKRNLLLLKGSVPGATGTLVLIRKVRGAA